MDFRDAIPNPPRILAISDLVRRLRVPRETLYKVGHFSSAYYRTRVTKEVKPDGRIKDRRIDAPRGNLKWIQRQIQRRLLAGIRFPDEMHGGIRERWILTNARVHLQQPEVLGLDLKDCFPSTSHGRVFQVWRDVLGCSTVVASLLTRLTTFNHCVPQGGRTSNSVVNLCLLPLHAALKDFCYRRGLRFSIYVDDLTVSGVGAIAAQKTLIRLIQAHHYEVSVTKIKGMRQHQQQSSTGIIVNRKASVPRDRRAAIRDRLFLLSRCKNIRSIDLQRVQSSILFVESVNKRQGLALRRLADRVVPILFTPPPKRTAAGATTSRLLTRRT